MFTAGNLELKKVDLRLKKVAIALQDSTTFFLFTHPTWMTFMMSMDFSITL
jgi:hypothetical protein